MLRLKQIIKAGSGKWWLSLSSAPFYASLSVVLALAVFMGLFWAVNEYQAYQESIDNIKKNYNSQYRSRAREELDKIIDFIEYKRAQSDALLEDDLRDKVQSAYSIASHMYSLEGENLVLDDMRERLLEVLRPIRWANGKGFYFIGRVEERQIDLFSDDPYFEGIGEDDFRDANNRLIIKDIISIIDEHGAGLYKYQLVKPAFPSQSFPVTSFVKFFKPFNWFIGAAVYSEDLEETLQKGVLERVQQMKFGNDGDVLGFRKDGTIIVSKDTQLVGRSIEDLIDHTGGLIGKRMLGLGKGATGDGYVQFPLLDTEKNIVHQKLNFVKAYEDWSWILSTGMLMDEMEQAIGEETATYQTISFRNVSMFMVMFTISVFLLLFATYIYSRKIEQGIQMFTDFFRKAADSKVKIKHSELEFREFEVLGSLANQMVDDRIQKELILKRNEVRLDTLLQLGMMEKYDLQDKYDFILKRVVEIADSTAGYLALVNNNQSHLTICSYVDLEMTDLEPLELGENTCPINASGLAGEAVMNGKAVLGGDNTGEVVFPYSKLVRNHLDVPIYDGEQVVLVCGVCNKNGLYDTADIRQMNMLMDGLWLHVIKTCSEKELANLERQVIAVSQDERSRIGQDLHDGLCSHLGGVELLSKALQQKLEKKTPEEAIQLGTIRDLIREAIEKTGLLARGLYPVHVIEQGLEVAFEELISEVEKSFNIDCKLEYDSFFEWSDNNIVTNLYYIVREAVFNAAKHGKASIIVLKVEREEQRYKVRVIDNGTGFVEQGTKRGMGLHTMKYRAKAMGSILTIDSEYDQGTVVTISG